MNSSKGLLWAAVVSLVACESGTGRPEADLTFGPMEGDASGGGDADGDGDDESEGGGDGAADGADDSPDDDDGPGNDDGPAADGCPGGDAAWDEVVASAESMLAAEGIPGAAIAVVCNGQLAHAAGIGVRSTDAPDPVTSQTRFQLASLTKMFTGAAGVALSEAGTVDLNTPISGVLPTVGYGNVTLHQLLTHTASYPTEFAQVMSNDLLTVVLDNGTQAMWAPPGAVWNYSNPGYAVAGAVLEQASGVPFADLIESEIFEPAAMTRATMRVQTVLAEGDYAYGHEMGAGPIAPDGSYFETGSYGPMGGAWGSVEDLAHWGEVHLQGGGAVLSEAGLASLTQFHTQTTSADHGYGYGVFVEDYFDPRVLSHGGSSPGFVSDWRVIPELGFGAFVILNGDWAYPGDLSDLIVDSYVDLGWQGYEDEPTLADLVGTYVDTNELGTVTITDDGGQLVANFGGSSQVMTPYGADTFGVFHPALGYEIQVTFWRGAGPQAEYLVSIWGIGTRS